MQTKIAMRRSRWRHPGLALLLPILLLAGGAWQVGRARDATQDAAARLEAVAASAARVEALVRQDPDATVRLGRGSQGYSPAEALRRLAERRAGLEWDAGLARFRFGAATVTVLGGGVVLLAVLGCLGATAYAASRGRRSRVALAAVFRGVVRAMPALLGGITVGTAAAVLGAALFEVSSPDVAADTGPAGIEIILPGVAWAGIGAMFAIRSVRQLRRVRDAYAPQPIAVLGRSVGPAEAPGLWNFVRAIAMGPGAPVPDHIVLGMTEGFFVTSLRTHLTPDGRDLAGRTLYLSAPMLPLLSRAEIAAIVAHELAHFSGEDTEYSQQVLPLFVGLDRAAAALEPRHEQSKGADMMFQPAAVLGGHVLGTLERLVGGWSRQREFEADRASLRAGPARAAALALVRFGMAWEAVHDTLGAVFERPSAATDDVVGDVLARFDVAARDPARHLKDRQPHPTDAHPPARQRIEALGILIDDGLLADASRPAQPEDAAFAASLFTDWPGLRQALGAELLEAARVQDRAFHAGLHEAVDAMADAVPVYEQPAAASVLFLLVGATLAAGAGFIAFKAATQPFDLAETGSGLILVALLGVPGVLLLWAVRARHRRAKDGPYLVIGADGFRCAGIEGVVSWSALERVEVTSGLRTDVTFRFKPSAPLPRQLGRRWSVRVQPQSRTLQLSTYKPRGLTSQAFLDLLNRALLAHRAQELLREREG